MLEDFGDIIDETHVQHAISLVEHDMFDPAKTDLATAKEVENSSGSSHNHLGSLSQLKYLLRLVHSTYDKSDSQSERLAHD